jgi:carbonic anhydrase
MQLWGTASTSSREILERFQSKALRIIVDAPRYVPNTVIRRDLHTPTVKEEIGRYSSQYSARLSVHPDDLVENHMAQPDKHAIAKTPAK